MPRWGRTRLPDPQLAHMPPPIRVRFERRYRPMLRGPWQHGAALLPADVPAVGTGRASHRSSPGPLWAVIRGVDRRPPSSSASFRAPSPGTCAGGPCGLPLTRGPSELGRSRSPFGLRDAFVGFPASRRRQPDESRSDLRLAGGGIAPLGARAIGGEHAMRINVAPHCLEPGDRRWVEEERWVGAVKREAW